MQLLAEEASSNSFKRSVKFGHGMFATILRFVPHKRGLIRVPRFAKTEGKVVQLYYSEATRGF